MATLSIAFGSFTKSKTIAAADVTRLVNAIKDRYPINVPAVLNPDGTVQTPATTRPPTNQEAFDLFADGYFQGLINSVHAYERAAAAKAPQDAIIPIPLT